MSQLHYTIQPSDPAGHLFRVTLHLPDVGAGGIRLALPAWIPGSYMIREFAKHISSVTATAGSGPVPVHKVDKHTWAVGTWSGDLDLCWEVYAWDLSVRMAHLDQTHGFFNGTSVFLVPEGLESRPVLLDILPPSGPQFAHWRVATALAAEGEEWCFGRYRARNYEELVDSPVELGDFSRFSFDACGTRHDVVLSGRHRADLARLSRDMQAICEAQIRFYGGQAPVDRYVFIILVVGEGYGGLEHRASTVLLCAREDLPLAEDREIRPSYQTFLGLVSHEYFHTWNVKRIKPAAFAPYDLSRENYTRQLWAFEGITSYYDDLMLVRAGLITPQAYLDAVAKTVSRVEAAPGRLFQSLADSSFDTWIKLYRPDENTANSQTSYYSKGALLALLLDLTMRRESGGRVSLDDLMQHLWDQYGRQSRALAEGEIEALVSQLTGTDFGDFFARHLHAPGDLPLAEALEAFGVRLERFVEGGKHWLGATLSGTETARLGAVLRGGPAHAAGLSAGDEIIALDDLKVGAKSLQARLDSYPPGSRLRVTAFRRDELMQFTLEITPAPATACRLVLVDDAGDRALARRTAWLSPVR